MGCYATIDCFIYAALSCFLSLLILFAFHYLLYLLIILFHLDYFTLYFISLICSFYIIFRYFFTAFTLISLSVSSASLRYFIMLSLRQSFHYAIIVATLRSWYFSLLMPHADRLFPSPEVGLYSLLSFTFGFYYSQCWLQCLLFTVSASFDAHLMLDCLRWAATVVNGSFSITADISIISFTLFFSSYHTPPSY